MPLFVCAGNSEPFELSVNGHRRIKSFFFTYDHACADVVEGDANRVAVDLVTLVQRSAGDNVGHAVGLIQGPLRQPPADILFVTGVDIVGLSDVDDNGHSGVLDTERFSLSFPNLRPLKSANCTQ